MKKIISMVMMTIMMMVATSVNAQNVHARNHGTHKQPITSTTNVRSHSKAFDNIDLTLTVGTLTTDKSWYKGHTACAPTINLGIDKYLTPVIAVGLDFRTMIGTGEVNSSRFNSKTAFDAINLSGVVKFNLANMQLFMPEGGYKYGRAKFEVKPYAQLGWGHNTCGDCIDLSDLYADGVRGVPSEDCGSMLRNKMTFRPGAQFVLNVGKKRNVGIVLDVSNVWGNIDNGRLCSKNGQFEASLGAVVHFNTSNGTNHFVEQEPIVRTVYETKYAEKVVTKTVNVETNKAAEYVVNFAKGSSDIANTSELDRIKAKKVAIKAYASPEGSSEFNLELSKKRAEAVKKYIEDHKIAEVVSAEGLGESDASNRIAIVTVEE